MNLVEGEKVIIEELNSYLKHSITFFDEHTIHLLKFSKITSFTSTTIVELSKLDLDQNQFKMFLKRSKIQVICGVFFITQFTKETIQQVKNAISKYHLSQILLLSSLPNHFYKGDLQYKPIEKELSKFIEENIKNVEP